MASSMVMKLGWKTGHIHIHCMCFLPHLVNKILSFNLIKVHCTISDIKAKLPHSLRCFNTINPTENTILPQSLQWACLTEDTAVAGNCHLQTLLGLPRKPEVGSLLLKLKHTGLSCETLSSRKQIVELLHTAITKISGLLYQVSSV